MTLLAGVRKGARGVVWYLKGILGEDAYEKYVAHHAALHAAGAADGTDGAAPHPLMTEREFWRDQTDRQDANPQGRCC
ncbi:YbdD/YjiX family protein [Cryobacterium sp. Hh38]|uniref:YbdD/YjiX family protein n=1 Tax=Cryobacterium sp. Hh38 TaxID=1259156 RepID=UPI00106D488C|nr:YbdD/YjiX family protein [Cryobacterium sp. Hh38]TFD63359.1 YbdD/YjiX family protein [Cryobacterium sp. Hh38]